MHFWKLTVLFVINNEEPFLQLNKKIHYTTFPFSEFNSFFQVFLFTELPIWKLWIRPLTCCIENIVNDFCLEILFYIILVGVIFRSKRSCLFVNKVNRTHLKTTRADPRNGLASQSFGRLGWYRYVLIARPWINYKHTRTPNSSGTVFCPGCFNTRKIPNHDQLWSIMHLKMSWVTT